MNLRRKQLGETRAHGLLPWGPASEIDICIYRKAHARQHMPQRGDLIACQPYGFAEPEPRIDPAFISLGAVVVDDALDPQSPMIAVGHVCQDGRILHWNGDLIIKAVAHPSLDLLLGELAAVH